MGEQSLIRESRYPNVFTDDGKLYTRNLTPGIKVYNERLVISGGVEYREWVPYRSKLAAFLKVGGECFPFNHRSRVLYLGAASGTTPSHVSDIVDKGMVYCIEFSPRVFRDLVNVCKMRRNMIPILADATRPSSYQFAIEGVDIIYQDIAQRDQAAIMLKNMETFDVGVGMLCVKSRSEDVSLRPEIVYRKVARWLRSAGCRILEIRSLKPYEKDHAMIVVER